MAGLSVGESSILGLSWLTGVSPSPSPWGLDTVGPGFRALFGSGSSRTCPHTSSGELSPSVKDEVPGRKLAGWVGHLLTEDSFSF